MRFNSLKRSANIGDYAMRKNVILYIRMDNLCFTPCTIVPL